MNKMRSWQSVLFEKFLLVRGTKKKFQNPALMDEFIASKYNEAPYELYKKLSEKTSTSKDVEAFEAAFSKLGTEASNLVEGYNEEDFKKLKATITEREANATIEEKALALIDQINKLSKESSPEDVEAARAKYKEIDLNKLTEATATRLEKMEKVLQSLENYFKEQMKTAEIEAQVVIERINKIDLNKYTATQINSIRNAYNALSLLAQKVVKDKGALDALIRAEQNIKYQNTTCTKRSH